MCPVSSCTDRSKNSYMMGNDAADTRIPAVQDLGGSGKSQLVLNYGVSRKLLNHLLDRGETERVY